MKSILLKFISTVIVLSLAFIFVPYLAVEQGWIEAVPSYLIEIIFTLALTTALLFYFLHKIQKSNPQGFIQLYLFSIALKMIVGCVLILVIIFVDEPGAMMNALFFIVSYFTLTGIEIFFLLRGKTST